MCSSYIPRREDHTKRIVLYIQQCILRITRDLRLRTAYLFVKISLFPITTSKRMNNISVKLNSKSQQHDGEKLFFPQDNGVVRNS